MSSGLGLEERFNAALQHLKVPEEKLNKLPSLYDELHEPLGP